MLHHNQTQQSAHETHVLSPWRPEIRHPLSPFFLALMGASALKIISPGISDDQYQSKESKVKTQVSQNGLALYIEIEK